MGMSHVVRMAVSAEVVQSMSPHILRRPYKRSAGVYRSPQLVDAHQDGGDRVFHMPRFQHCRRLMGVDQRGVDGFELLTAGR